MKYKRKPLFVEAQEYKIGMEDAFRCNDMVGIYCTKKYCILPIDKAKYIDSLKCRYRVPIIKSKSSDYYIYEGDYIVTRDGEKYPMNKDAFESQYEPVE